MSIGEEWVWDFGFRYNLIMLDLPELEVLMIKYEVGTETHQHPE